MVELTDATFGALLEPASGGRALCVTNSTLPEFADELVALDGSPSAAVTAFRAGEPVFVGEAALHRPETAGRLRAAGIGSTLCQSIALGGETLGVLAIGWADAMHDLDDRATELVAMASDEAGRALQRRAAMSFFAGACGLISGPTAEDRQTPPSTSFCQYAVSAGRPLIVRDAREVPLLRDNPAIEERGVVAYAGIPLVDADDNVLGVLCAIDHEPRAWSDEDIATLRRLARQRSAS